MAKKRKGPLLGAKVTRVWVEVTTDFPPRPVYERAIVYKVDRKTDTLCITVVHDDGMVERGTIELPLSREGIEWCRGWSGEALRAMKTVIAIGAPPRQASEAS